MALGNELRKKFGGFIVISKKIYGKSKKKKGRIVYRCTVLHRRLGFREGDVVAFDERIYKITSTKQSSDGQKPRNRQKRKN